MEAPIDRLKAVAEAAARLRVLDELACMKGPDLAQALYAITVNESDTMRRDIISECMRRLEGK